MFIRYFCVANSSIAARMAAGLLRRRSSLCGGREKIFCKSSISRPSLN